jgi:tRNA 2-(methylsulfanyl)-N6-isopentenyladenosine37 hydroxylase
VLGLAVPTDSRWVAHALMELPRVLVDHAHCELKAASNALSLVGRYPDDTELVLALAALAQEEMQHFAQAMGFLTARGLTLGAPQVNAYAQQLRGCATALPARHLERLVLVDRLLIGSLIEARSCERFKLLAAALEARIAADPEAATATGDRDLHAFYMDLFACEARHYRTYVDLAKLAASTGLPAGSVHASDLAVEERLALLASAEGKIVANLATQPERAMIHG